MTKQIEPKIISKEIFDSGTGKLFFVENGDGELFNICRIFFIQANLGAIRGRHAHKVCSQWLSVVSGEVRITLKDGQIETLANLHEFAEIMIIEPGTWIEIEFLSDGVLVVGANYPYEESDYIRNWNDFLIYRGSL